MKIYTEQEIHEAADKYVFDEADHNRKWSNNDDTAGDNFGSFKAGAQWAISQMQPEWVSVEDELPETLQSVICELKNGAVFQLTYGRLTGFFDPMYGKPVSDNNPVVQWTPLPQPPNKVR